MVKAWIKLCALIVLVSTLGACHGGKTVEKPPAQLSFGGGSGQSSLMQHVNGKFVIYNGCLLLVSDKGKRYRPVFPKPVTRWDGDTLVIGKNRMGLGQSVSVGGGAVDPASATVFDRPVGCPAKVPVWLLDASAHAR